MTDFKDYMLSQATFWAISFVFNFNYLSSHQHLKLGGYFVFYKKMHKIVSILFAVPSFFSSLLLAVVGVLSKTYHFYPSYFDIKYELLLRYLMIGVISVELLVETTVLIKYIISVKKFNRQRPVPDVERFEYLLPSDARSSSEIGYRLEGEAVADLLEKQADLICYYKSTIIDLKSKLAEPQTCH
ncbi:transmembrane protein 192 isoform X2 [Halyomorpha halys]|nr:transmembrane protein 192 isoform X2 [Halyomorpha halys]XP_014271668.1 transmembrane protein 192 isoform X2 [Halyomorpha halys]